jgi:hypothetical protein
MELCLNCQEKLVHLEGRKRKKFCKPECRISYWQKNNPRKEKKFVRIETFMQLEIQLREAEAKLQECKEAKNAPVASNETIPDHLTEKTTNTPETPKTEEKGLNIPPMPIREPNENAFDFAARKNEWKKQYNQ